MKRILVSLLAIISMFVFTNVNAATVTVCATGCTHTNLPDAITAVTDADTIKLEENIALVATQEINKKVTIDLNGYTISKDRMPLRVQGGELTLTGAGTVKETAPWFGAVVVKGSDTPTDTNYSVVNIGKDVILEGFFALFIDATTAGNGYGIVINVAGTAKGMNDGYDNGAGIYIQGKIKHKTNYPIINVASTAKIESVGLGIYAAGYANWTFADGVSVSGVDSAMAIKSGKVTINGGTWTVTGPDTTPTTGWSAGVNGSGATIQLESNSAYAGDIELVINDGTFVSTNGRVIYEYLGKAGDTDTAVSSVEINDGSFVASAGKDVFMFSQEFGDKITKFVNGGTYSSDPSAYANDGVIFVANGQGIFGEKVETPVVDPEKKDPVKNPETSDNIVFYIVTALISLSLLVCVALVLKKTKKVLN